MKARISFLHKTEAEWNALSSWVPASAELVVYDADDTHDYARIKLGDGKTPLCDLNFFIDRAILEALKNQSTSKIIDGGRIENYKNN